MSVLKREGLRKWSWGWWDLFFDKNDSLYSMPSAKNNNILKMYLLSKALGVCPNDYIMGFQKPGAEAGFILLLWNQPLWHMQNNNKSSEQKTQVLSWQQNRIFHNKSFHWWEKCGVCVPNLESSGNTEVSALSNTEQWGGIPTPMSGSLGWSPRSCLIYFLSMCLIFLINEMGLIKIWLVSLDE